MPNIYIRDGGTGDGSAWNNALPALPAALVRGNTYYIADGAYPGYTCNAVVSGTTPITIKKATIAYHGTSTGWLDSYGDGVATFNGSFGFDTAYHVFDGQTGGGPGAWKTGFGFKINVPAGAGLLATANNLSIRHVDVQGNGGDGDGAWPSNDGVFIAGNNITISYTYIHDFGRCIIYSNNGSTGIVIEYMWSGYHESTSGQHSETMSIWGAGTDNWTVRWSVITHSEGTGGIMYEGNDLKVYGCVFVPLDGNSLGGGNGLIGTWTVSACTNLKVYNNSFIDNDAFVLGILNENDTGEFKNNIVYSGAVGNFNGLDRLTHTHNHYVAITDGPITEATQTTGASDPFVDYVGLNFALTANTTAGATLSAPYNVDMLGQTRSTWTRGAIEFVTVPGSGTTRASDGSRDDVAAKIALSSAGDRITLPAGSFTWTTGIQFAKGVRIQGAGGARVIARSISSVQVGMGAKTFVLLSARAKTALSAYFSVTPGQILRIWRTAGSDGTPYGSRVWMEGTVTSYDVGTSSLAMNITSTSGGTDTHGLWIVATNPATTINHAAPGDSLLNCIEDPNGSIEISGIYFNSAGGSAPGNFLQVQPATNGRPVLVHDCGFRQEHNSTISGGIRDVTAMMYYSKQGVVWNCSFIASVFASAPFCIGIQPYSFTTSWTTASTWGAQDTTGRNNHYVEDCDFHGFLNTTDVADNARSVIRRCLFNAAGIGSHGNDSDTYGARHCEVYDCEWNFNYLTDTTTAWNSWQILIRGGSWVIADNVLPSNAWGLNPSMINIGVWKLSPDYGGWGSGDGGSPDYPAPRQSGFGRVTGLGGNDAGGVYMGDLEPIYIWGTTPGIPNVGLNPGPPAPGADLDNIADYLQAGRDYYNNGTQKPGYAKFTASHPLRTDTTAAATPDFSPAAGSFSTVQTVTITTATAGATIHYTLDGSTPTTGSPVYATPLSFGFGTTVLKAISVKSGLENSAIRSGTYVITAPPPAGTDFPLSPTVGQIHTIGNRKWQWNGTGWKRVR